MCFDVLIQLTCPLIEQKQLITGINCFLGYWAIASR